MAVKDNVTYGSRMTQHRTGRRAFPAKPENTCPACGFVSIARQGLMCHVRLSHGLSPKSFYEKFMSNLCRQCNKQIPFSKHGMRYTRKTRFCSAKCRSLNSPPAITAVGYMAKSLFEYPAKHYDMLSQMVVSNSKRILEHRAVVAISLSRALESYETVHHRNGDRADNRPENLELRVGQHGNGATASSLMCPHCGKRYDEPK